MDSDRQLEKQIEQYQGLAKENKNVDVAALMISALSNQNKNNFVSSKQKKWAYTASLALPPIGLFLAMGYYLSDKSDAKTVAKICIFLTILSAAAFWYLGKMLFSGAGVDIRQLQQIRPQDIQQLTQ